MIVVIAGIFVLCVTLNNIPLILKNFNRQIFIIQTVLLGLLLVPSFLATWANEEGTLNKNSGWQIFVDLFYVLRFPTHTLFWSIINKAGGFFYFIGLLLNCCFYSLLIERVVYLLRKPKLV